MSIMRITALILAGVAIGMTAGAVLFSTLPLWLGVPTIAAISIVTVVES